MLKRIFPKILLVAVAVFGVLALSGVLSAQGLSHEAFERVKEVQERHTDHLMEIKEVVGTAVGFNQNNRPAVKVFVSRWDLAGIPKNLDGVPVQVVVTGRFYALDKPVNPSVKPPKDEIDIDPTARFERAVPIGVSTGHPHITAGTIGCRVIDDDNNVYALSNNHVYANCNEALKWDNVLQPGTYDDGIDPDDAIGTLWDFEPIDFGSRDNTIDAAIALSSTDLLSNATPSDGYGKPKSTTIEAKINQPVKKYGRTTGLTKGRVYAINATVDVNYKSGVARFVSQIIITPGSFSAGGDSGSLVVIDGKGRNKQDDRKPVGLLFAGNNLLTIANPIDEVLLKLGVSVDGE